MGCIAISLLSQLGWHVIASTGRMAEAGFLKGLGAAEIIDRSELSEPGKPLAKERWAAGIDSVGSHTLANLWRKRSTMARSPPAAWRKASTCPRP